MSTNNQDLVERYRACMILHAVGDAMGYRNNLWESNKSTEKIHEELRELGGIEEISCDPVNWGVSDDTILHLSNAEWLIESNDIMNTKSTFLNLIKHYKKALNTEDQVKRSFGNTTVFSILNSLNENNENGYRIPFNEKGYGCGASMRSPCIGLRYSKENDFEKLIEISIESSRMTHHYPLGYLGGFVAALFTSYAIQNKPVYSWGASMLNILPKCLDYIKKDNYLVDENIKEWQKFENYWKDYLKLRKIETGLNPPVFPDVYGIKERDEFYKTYALSTGSGSSGHDSCIIAYDALMGSNGNWNELCYRGVLHGGDNDSTGCIAGAWFGALYGFKTVPPKNFEMIEYKERLLNCANKLYEFSNK